MASVSVEMSDGRAEEPEQRWLLDLSGYQPREEEVGLRKGSHPGGARDWPISVLKSWAFIESEES